MSSSVMSGLLPATASFIRASGSLYPRRSTDSQFVPQVDADGVASLILLGGERQGCRSGLRGRRFSGRAGNRFSLGAALLAGGVVAFWAEQSIMLLASNPARSIGFGQNIE